MPNVSLLGVQPAQFKFTDRFYEADGPLNAPWQHIHGVNQFSRIGGKAVGDNTGGVAAQSAIEGPNSKCMVAVDFSTITVASGALNVAIFIGLSASSSEGYGMVASAGVGGMLNYEIVYQTTAGAQTILTGPTLASAAVPFRLSLAYDPVTGLVWYDYSSVPSSGLGPVKPTQNVSNLGHVLTQGDNRYAVMQLNSQVAGSTIKISQFHASAFQP